jgi:uncharacterized coiled-coil DUF342 family protein
MSFVALSEVQETFTEQSMKIQQLKSELKEREIKIQELEEELRALRGYSLPKEGHIGS